MDRRPGCLTGLLELFFANSAYKWAQNRFGFGRGGCFGCGCGFILLIVMIIVVLSILFGTDWTHIRLLTPLMMLV